LYHSTIASYITHAILAIDSLIWCVYIYIYIYIYILLSH
jgi:hypothetical protein